MPGNDPFLGGSSQVAYGVETNGGPATPTGLLQKLSDDTEQADPETNWYEERYIGGGRELDDLSPGQRVFEGGSYPMQVVNAVPLVWLLGNESFDTDTHTITAAGADDAESYPPAFTTEATLYGRGGANDFVRTFENVYADSGTIGVDNDSRLTCEIGTVAGGVSTGSSPTDVGTLSGADPFLWSDISSDISINGTTFARLLDFELGVENNAVPHHYITSDVSNQGDPFEVIPGNINYDFSATIVADDDALYQEVVSADTLVDISLQFTRENGDTLDINLNGVGLQEAPHGMSRGDSADDERVEVEATGIPTGLEIILTDTVRGAAVLPGQQA
jgi:hypothetical protein